MPNKLKEQIEQAQIAFVKKMEQARTKTASLADICSIVLARSRIEQWVEEPFLKKTVTDCLCRVNLHKRYYLAKIVGIDEIYETRKTQYGEERVPALYRMTNNKSTNVKLKLSVKEGNIFSVKIDQLSNTKITDEEYSRFSQTFKVNCEEVYLKQIHIKKAKNYVYQPGELGEIAEKKFDRALKLNDFSDFPNVTYFHKKKLLKRDELSTELANVNDDNNPETVEESKQRLKELNIEIAKIEAFLAKDNRIVQMLDSDGQRKRVGIDTLVEAEDKKKYHEWLESQQADREKALVK